MVGVLVGVVGGLQHADEDSEIIFLRRFLVATQARINFSPQTIEGDLRLTPL